MMTTLSEPTSVSVVPTQTGAGIGFTHAIESELAGATIPRVARRKKHNIGITRFLWNAMLVCVGLMGFLWRRDYETWNALIARGVATQATVYNKHITTGKSTHYYLDYRFDTEKGMISDTKSVSSSTYDSTYTGDHLSVTYLPEGKITKWQVGEVSTARRDEQTRAWVGGTLGIAAFWGLLIAVLFYTTKKQLRFLQEGGAAVGRVTEGKVIRGKQTTYRLFYSYLVGENSHVGVSDVDADRYRQITEGNPYFTVLYNPNKPSDSMPYFKVTEAYLVAA